MKVWLQQSEDQTGYLIFFLNMDHSFENIWNKYKESDCDIFSSRKIRSHHSKNLISIYTICNPVSGFQQTPSAF